MGTTFLFAPADRPERVLRAASLADIVIIDLEDAVEPQSRLVARQALVGIAGQLDPERSIVRINARSTPDFPLDIAAIMSTHLAICMVAKTESADDLRAVKPLNAVALIETPLGVMNGQSIAAADSCVGLMFGSEDLALELGASQSRRGGVLIDALETARHLVLLAARSKGRFAIDAAYVDLNDDVGLEAEAVAAAVMGFDAKASVHPRQLSTIRKAFLPSEADTTWARNIIASASNRTKSVYQVGDQMVDAPIIRRAESILRRLPLR
jgi:citrate lyase subunit beta/citryl-CoA lyase